MPYPWQDYQIQKFRRWGSGEGPPLRIYPRKAGVLLRRNAKEHEEKVWLHQYCQQCFQHNYWWSDRQEIWNQCVGSIDHIKHTTFGYGHRWLATKGPNDSQLGLFSGSSLLQTINNHKTSATGNTMKEILIAQFNYLQSTHVSNAMVLAGNISRLIWDDSLKASNDGLSSPNLTTTQN